MKDPINSNELKRKTWRAMFSIVCFALSYLLLILLALGLTALCFYASYIIFGFSINVLTLVLGLGIASIGILVLVFLLKFVFYMQKPDRSFLSELKAADEPELFALIAEIADKVGTAFPKRIYLSADVNAMVFYNSSFWSMFFPVRKNLSIGVGLINAVNREELKAILVHEFGHFAQGSMRTGSYVYNVNQILYNLLYNNDAYENLITRWLGASNALAFFAKIALLITKGIQRVLQLLYGFVNTSYLALSREMEFQADAVAAKITGYEPLKSALLRLELADFAFKSTLAFYEDRFSACEKSADIYADHAYVMRLLASKSDIVILDGFPQLTAKDLNKYVTSKIVVEDQWASHPSTTDRVERLEQLNSAKFAEDKRAAMTIFKDSGHRSSSMTDFLFAGIPFEKNPVLIQSSEFASMYEEAFVQNSFSELYNGYYDEKNPSPFDLNLNKGNASKSIEDLFLQDQIDCIQIALGLKNDITFLEQLNEGLIDFKSFHYDGTRFLKKEAKKLSLRLKQELKSLEKEILEWDKSIYLTFMRIANQEDAAQLDGLYQDFFEFEGHFDEQLDVYNQLNRDLQFVSKVTPDYEIVDNFREIEKKELVLREKIEDLLEDDLLKVDLKPAIIKSLNLYISKKWRYFGVDKYYDEDLAVLYDGLNAFYFALSRLYFLKKKRLLDFQAAIYQKSKKGRGSLV